MKNRVTIRIAGEEYVVLTEENADYMQQIAGMVEEKLLQSGGTPSMSLHKTAILAACNLADDCCKANEKADNLRRQVNQYMREADTLRRELADSQNLLEELTQPKNKKS